MSDQGSTGTDRAGVFGRRKPKPSAEPAGPPAVADGLDPITGLPGRSVLHDWLQRAERAGRPTSTQVVLAFVDLDSLRDVNDGLGPDAGDEVLRQVAARLSSIDLFGALPLRYGGAEFAVVLGQVHGADSPSRIAHAILDQVTAPFDLGGVKVTVACHVGLAVGSDAAGGPADLVRDAHQALVHARDGGAGSFVVHDESRRGRYTTRIDESRMHSAIENEEFLLHYQPIVRTDGRRHLRGRGPPAVGGPGSHQHRDALPSRVPAAAREVRAHRARRPVGAGRDVRQAMTWTRNHPESPALFVTVNISARQLAMPDFETSVLGRPRPSGDATRAAVPRHHRAGAALQRLRHLVGAAPPQARRRQARVRRLRHRRRLPGRAARPQARSGAHRPVVRRRPGHERRGPGHHPQRGQPDPRAGDGGRGRGHRDPRAGRRAGHPRGRPGPGVPLRPARGGRQDRPAC